MSAERWTPDQYGSMRVEGLFKPSSFEAFYLYDPRNKSGPFAVALVRWSSGTRVRAWCIDGGHPIAELSRVKGLDGKFRFTGPIISYKEPVDKSVVMAHVQGPIGSNVHFFIIDQGYDGRCGVYDLRMSPFGNYIDEEDAAERQESLRHTKERNRLQDELQKLSQRQHLVTASLSSSEEEIRRLQAELKVAKSLEGARTQREHDLLVLGLGDSQFDNLSIVDRMELLSALERELYRSLHPDRFNKLGRDTTSLQTTAAEVIQLKIAAIQRLKREFAIT